MDFPIEITVSGPRDVKAWATWFRSVRDYIVSELCLGNGEWAFSRSDVYKRKRRVHNSYTRGGGLVEDEEWVFCFREANATQAVQFKLRWAQ